jgi:hypothetical protein
MIRNGVQVACQGATPVQGPRPAEQHEKRGLKGIFGVGAAAEEAAANTEDHRTVPADQDRKRGLIAPGDEAVQQLAVVEFLEALGTQELM